MMQDDNWRRVGNQILCWDHWIECDYCETPMPRTLGEIRDRWACTACTLKHERCGHGTGHQYVDEGYRNLKGGWVEVITCTLCSHVQHEGVRRD